MSKMAYNWKLMQYKVAADVAGKELERIGRTVGLTPANVVSESREEDAPLHCVFEWDDTVASEKWREQQARVMIANLVIVSEDVEDAPAVRAFVKLEESPHYESTRMILQVEEKRTSLFHMAMKELLSFRKKYSDLREFDRLFTLIDAMEGEAV